MDKVEGFKIMSKSVVLRSRKLKKRDAMRKTRDSEENSYLHTLYYVYHLRKIFNNDKSLIVRS